MCTAPLQMSHVSTQTEWMKSIATMTIKAAATEEAIGSGDDSSHDPELREQVERVRVTMSEIAKLTPQFLSAAKQALVGGKDQPHRDTSTSSLRRGPPRCELTLVCIGVCAQWCSQIRCCSSSSTLFLILDMQILEFSACRIIQQHPFFRIF